MNLIFYLIVNSLAVFITSYILPGIHVSSLVTIITVAVVLGIVNTFIKPILVLLTLPLTIVTLGLFILVLNALIVMFVAYVVPGFTVDNFWWALLFSLVISIVSWFLTQLTKSTTA